jgi:hypothetical protein
MQSEPALAVAAVRSAVEQAGCVITDATRFSNMALSFKVEAYAHRVPALVAALRNEAALHAAHELPAGAPALDVLPPDTEVDVLLHVALVHDLPDERIELPKVPG